MPKILLLLLTLSLLCNCKEQQPAQVPKEEEKFESTIDKVVYTSNGDDTWNVVVTKTETGAFAEQKSHPYLGFGKSGSDAELSAKEWQDFIKALHNLRFSEWQKEYNGTKTKSPFVFHSDHKWNLDISSSDKKEDYSFSGENAYPPNWSEFEKIIEDLAKQINAKEKREKELTLETKLAMEYEKKFGKSISDFELSMKEIIFHLSKDDKYNPFVIFRTEAGAILKYGPFESELSLGEWLDFIRALYKCNIEGWEKKYEKDSFKVVPAEKWELTIYSSAKYYPYAFSGKNTYPPSWKEFKKIMDAMMTRAKKIKEDADNKLKAEYQKKFGDQITDFELSIRDIKFSNLTISKMATGAFATLKDLGQMELSSEEWLDLIRTLHKCNIEGWEIKRESSIYSDGKWKIQVFSFDGYKVFGSNTYPPDLDELDKKMSEIEKKIRIAPYVEIRKKLEDAYQKKFGESISEFELSIKQIEFDTYGLTSVKRTKTGALAYYFLRRPDFERIDLELTTDEWLDFIRALRKYKIDEWNYTSKFGDVSDWYLEVDFDIYDGRAMKGYKNKPPPNWAEFKKTMDKILARIKAEPARVKKEGVGKLENEAPINKVIIYNKELGAKTGPLTDVWSIVVTKTETGALAKYKLYGIYGDDDVLDSLEAELSVNEWQNFIKALYNTSFNEWQEKYNGSKYAVDMYYYKWNLDIFCSDKKEDKSFAGENAYPPNWKEFKKTMKDMIMTIKRKAEGQPNPQDANTSDNTVERMK